MNNQNKSWTTQRGKITSNRPLRGISMIERVDILKDYLELGSKEVKTKWNISKQTLEHIKYHQKKMLNEIEELNLKRLGL